MFDAQYVFNDTLVYTPWFPRLGDTLLVTGELLQVNGGGSKLEVFAYSKALEADGNGAISPSPRLTMSAVGLGEREFTGLKNLVRLRISNPSTTSGDYILQRILGLTWYDAVKA